MRNGVTGCIEAATDLPWKSPIPLYRKHDGEAISGPTLVTNDANAAAIGEMTYGSAVGLKNFIVLTLGTGVGSGIVCDGHLLSGTRGFAGELGHVTFPLPPTVNAVAAETVIFGLVASAKGIRETTKTASRGDR